MDLPSFSDTETLKVSGHYASLPRRTVAVYLPSILSSIREIEFMGSQRRSLLSQKRRGHMEMTVVHMRITGDHRVHMGFKQVRRGSHISDVEHGVQGAQGSARTAKTCGSIFTIKTMFR